MGVIGACIGAALASKLNVDFQQIAHVAPSRKDSVRNGCRDSHSNAAQEEATDERRTEGTGEGKITTIVHQA